MLEIFTGGFILLLIVSTIFAVLVFHTYHGFAINLWSLFLVPVWVLFVCIAVVCIVILSMYSVWFISFAIVCSLVIVGIYKLVRLILMYLRKDTLW